MNKMEWDYELVNSHKDNKMNDNEYDKALQINIDHE